MDPPQDPPPPSPPHGPFTPDDPQPLAYQPKGAPRAGSGPGGNRFLSLFLAGAIGGTAVSAIAWIGGWEAIDKGGAGFLLVVIPGIKLAAGVPMLCFRRWRGLGAGIMVSLALGFLIFFGTCMTNLKI